jgi:hypothetical protein
MQTSEETVRRVTVTWGRDEKHPEYRTSPKSTIMFAVTRMVIELCDGAHERLQVYGYRKDGRWPEPGREPRGREYYDGDMPSGLWAIVQDVLHPRPAPADAGALDGTRSGLRRKEETKWRRSQETGRSPRRGKSTGCPAR